MSSDADDLQCTESGQFFNRKEHSDEEWFFVADTQDQHFGSQLPLTEEELRITTETENVLDEPSTESNRPPKRRGCRNIPTSRRDDDDSDDVEIIANDTNRSGLRDNVIATRQVHTDAVGMLDGESHRDGNESDVDIIQPAREARRRRGRPQEAVGNRKNRKRWKTTRIKERMR